MKRLNHHLSGLLILIKVFQEIKFNIFLYGSLRVDFKIELKYKIKMKLWIYIFSLCQVIETLD